MVIGAYADLQSMNAFTSTDYNSGNVQRDLLFMPLIRYDEQIRPVPWLAERWDTATVAGDSLEITWHLRRDVRWHDGVPTTAEDVAFTLERGLDPGTGFPNLATLSYYRAPAEVVDSFTVRMRLHRFSEFMDIWYQTPIMPKHILQGVSPEQLIQHPFGVSQPVGNGPFRHVRRVPGQEWIFEANPDFPEALGGRPYLDRVVWRYIPEMTTLLSELLTGRIDVYVRPNPNQAPRILAAQGIEFVEHPFRQWVYFAFNTRRPLFQDARVRRAMAMAVDREQIVEALLYGYAEVGRGTATPGDWMYDADDPQQFLPYDTVAARRLLQEAGWSRAPDGVLRDTDGNQFRFTAITNHGNDIRRDILEIMQAQLRPLGIVLTPRLIEWNTMVATLQDPRRDFDAVVSSWVGYFRKDDTDILHSRNLDRPYQYVGYSNPRIDQLLDTLALTIDRDAARPLWREYQRLIVQEAPYIPIYYPSALMAYNARLRDVRMDTRSELQNVTRWWIHPRDRRPGETATSQPVARQPPPAN